MAHWPIYSDYTPKLDKCLFFVFSIAKLKIEFKRFNRKLQSWCKLLWFRTMVFLRGRTLELKREEGNCKNQRGGESASVGLSARAQSSLGFNVQMVRMQFSHLVVLPSRVSLLVLWKRSREAFSVFARLVVSQQRRSKSIPRMCANETRTFWHKGSFKRQRTVSLTAAAPRRLRAVKKTVNRWSSSTWLMLSISRTGTNAICLSLIFKVENGKTKIPQLWFTE